MQPMRDIMMEYRMLANRRFGIYRKANFALNLTGYVKDFKEHQLIQNLIDRGKSINLPLVLINKLCDIIYDPNVRIRVKRNNKYVKIPLMSIEEELLNMEQMIDQIVMKHRAELDDFVTSTEADVL